VIQDLWIPIAYINGGGLCLRWFRDELAPCRLPGQGDPAGSVYALLDEGAAALPPGSGDLVFLPHFGGRVTPNNPDVRGTWLGLSWGHKAEHLYRSILEGIAYEYRCYADVLGDIVPGFQLREARVIGGGAKSRVWNQIKADVLGVPYVQLDRDEIAVWGAALIAGHAVGLYPDLARAASAGIRPTQRFEPDATAHRRYEPYVEVYKGLFERLAPSFERLRAAGEGAR
ncbi:MAG: xylulokinase, partial [Chitinophagales bacterium]